MRRARPVPRRRRSSRRARSTSSARRCSAARACARSTRATRSSPARSICGRIQKGGVRSTSCRPARARRGASAASPTLAVEAAAPRAQAARAAAGRDRARAIRATIEGALSPALHLDAATGAPGYAQLRVGRAVRDRRRRRGRLRAGRVLPPQAAAAREQPAHPARRVPAVRARARADPRDVRRQTVKGDFTRVTFEPRTSATPASACSRGACSSTPTGTSRPISSRYLDRTEATDAIGRAGAPKAGGSFAVAVDAGRGRSRPLARALLRRRAPLRAGDGRPEIASFPSATTAELAGLARPTTPASQPAAGSSSRRTASRPELRKIAAADETTARAHARRRRERLRRARRTRASARHDVPHQPDLPAPAAHRAGRGARTDLVYLDVWEHEVTRGRGSRPARARARRRRHGHADADGLAGARPRRASRATELRRRDELPARAERRASHRSGAPLVRRHRAVRDPAGRRLPRPREPALPRRDPQRERHRPDLQVVARQRRRPSSRSRSS